MSDTKPLSFTDFRQRIGDLRGKEYWRSLEELARSDAFDEFFAEEFPRQALPLQNGVDRRNFLKLMGASAALAGLAACRQPADSIVPYVRQPENLIPGKPLYFATAMPLGGYATGVLVESHLNRPTKIEGNPDHPSALGASDAFMQASILGLYDPDRSQVVRKLGDISTFSDFIAALQPVIAAAKTNGAGLRILTQTITSPSHGALINQFRATYPGARWHQWEPAGRDNAREGARLAFGGYADVHYDLTKANVILSLGSDLFSSGPGHLRYARDFASRRRVRKGTLTMNRLYVVETTPSSTGGVADHRFPVKPSEIEAWARAIAQALGLAAGATAIPPEAAAIAKDLQANRGASLVVAGDDQPPAVHAIVHAINSALGNVGVTALVTDPAEVEPVNQLESLRQLVTDMNAGAVQALVILGGNPVFDAPTDFRFADAMQKVPFRAHLSGYYDETSLLAHWHIPEAHYLETWGDARGHDGSVVIMQPLIEPLYNGRSPIEVLGALLNIDTPPYDYVRKHWLATGATEQTWRKWLNDGVVTNSALPTRAAAASAAIPPSTVNRQPSTPYELAIRPDPNLHDGRYANNGWLQELPRPVTKIAWDNVLLVSPTTAEAIGLGSDQRDTLINDREAIIVKVTYRGRSINLPLWVVPGHADGAVTIHFGYGRTQGGKLAGGGVDIYPWRFSDALLGGGGAEIIRTHERNVPIACTQEHQSIDPKVVGERGIIRAATLAEYAKNPHFAQEAEHAEPSEAGDSIYPPYHYEPNGTVGYRWAMSIDTSVCTGCNGCVIACQAENNIPIVGKEEVHREREMHWLRIDRYFRGSVSNPEVYHQPVPCMQCEVAPCEPVCPVGATSHSGDGLNDMTYNRCVGTRYCSNNCPYKVRRFNFFHYADYDTPALKPMRNPDVTVRTRGVMEKCTYCVQRINEAKITAEREDRRVRDGEIVTACQQACPTEAIVFGDLNDPNSRVAKLKGEPTNYALLEELNTRPRTTYLATVRNPNPEIKQG